MKLYKRNIYGLDKIHKTNISFPCPFVRYTCKVKVKEAIDISKNKLVVPEAREAFEKYKMEIANEFGLDDLGNLASKHSGIIVRNLVADGQRQLMKKEEQNPKK